MASLPGDKASALDAMLTTGGPNSAPVPAMPAEVEPDEAMAGQLELEDLVTDFKLSEDPQASAAIFLRMVEMAKRLS